MYAIVIGSSTGGPQALTTLLNGLPDMFDACIIILQHLPSRFTNSMAERLDKSLPFPVHHMQHNQKLESGHVYIVPGDCHFTLLSPQRRAYLISAGDAATHPSIDIGFTSVAESFGPKTIGVVLTGMGSDGVLGAKAIKQLGGHVITQDETTSTVYGMPKSVQIAGYADETLPLIHIAKRLERLTSHDTKSAV